MLLRTLLIIVTALSTATARAQAVDDAVQYAPLAAAVALDYCGVEARHRLRERVAVGVTSYAALTAVAGGLKLTVSERRPDGSDRRSFPSGHAARAFAGAELVRTEYGWGWGLGAYAVAAGVGVLRVSGDHHYAHDVLAGAAIGVAASRLAYWLLPLERRWLGWDETGVAVSATPACDYDTRTVGFALTATF